MYASLSDAGLDASSIMILRHWSDGLYPEGQPALFGIISQQLELFLAGKLTVNIIISILF
jgi:hypothetical protein